MEKLIEAIFDNRNKASKHITQKTPIILLLKHLPINQIKALIQCGKLKNAYLVAINAKLPDEVRRIADVAAKAGQLSVRDICEKWLQQHHQKK